MKREKSVWKIEKGFLQLTFADKELVDVSVLSMDGKGILGPKELSDQNWKDLEIWGNKQRKVK